MSLHRRKWKQKEKEEILLYMQEHGVSKASREYNVSTTTIYNWKNKFDELGSEGLDSGAKKSTLITNTTRSRIQTFNQRSVLNAKTWTHFSN